MTDKEKAAAVQGFSAGLEGAARSAEAMDQDCKNAWLDGYTAAEHMLHWRKNIADYSKNPAQGRKKERRDDQKGAEA